MLSEYARNVKPDVSIKQMKEKAWEEEIANLDQKELVRALTLFSERNVDIVDCILCVKASGPNTSLFSFDNDLCKMSNSNR